MQISTSGKALKRWIVILRISIGIIYLWFGILKFFPGVSPAESLARDTIHLLTFKLLDDKIALLLLAIWETAAGILLISGIYIRLTIRIVLVHMFCTFTPLILLPGLSFSEAPLSLTLIGQYIIKNIVIVSALFLLESTSPKNN
jgi:uncharacterized membrane protein YphA (DoxX/SURF4 family)